jgi:hypothetical protein
VTNQIWRTVAGGIFFGVLLLLVPARVRAFVDFLASRLDV